MDFNLTIISWILFSTFIVTGSIAIYSHVKGYSNHQLYFTLMMVMIAEWSLMSMLESAAVTIPSKVFWSKLEYIGALSTGVFFLRYALGVAEIRESRIKKNFWAFWILPFIIVCLAATNEFHNLIWTGFEWSPDGVNILIYKHGPAFYIGIIYSLILVLVAQIVIIRAHPEMPLSFRRQARSVILACIFPFVAALIYTTGYTLMEGLNITVLSFSVSGIIILFGITRYRIFDIAPFARKRLTEIMQDAIIVVDSDAKIIYHNPSASSLLQIESKYFYSDLAGISWLYKPCATLLEQSTAQSDIIIQNEEKEWFYVQVLNMNDDHSNLKAKLLVIRNITRIKTLEIQTQRLNEELTTSHDQLLTINAQKNKIISIIGHDLKTPFHQISSLSGILMNDLESFSREEITGLLGDISTASGNGLGVLTSLLDWAKEQRRHSAINPELFTIHELIRAVAAETAPGIAAKELTVDFEMNENSTVFADRNMVMVALRNLVSNAIKFSYAGGRILIQVQTDGSKTLIKVSDDGIGIEEDNLKQLFSGQGNTSLPGTAGETGTGLGLMLVSELIVSNKGRIDAESKAGKGTKFTITLPATFPD